MNSMKAPWFWPLWRRILKPETPATPSGAQLATLFLVLFALYLTAIGVAIATGGIPAIATLANPLTGLLMAEVGMAMLMARTPWSALDMRRWLIASATAATPTVALTLFLHVFTIAQIIALIAVSVALFAVWTAAIAVALERDGIVS